MRSSRMHEKYVHHNIVQKDIGPLRQRIYTQDETGYIKAFRIARARYVVGTYDDLERVHRLKIISSYNSVYESARA